MRVCADCWIDAAMRACAERGSAAEAEVGEKRWIKVSMTAMIPHDKTTTYELGDMAVR